MTDFEYEVPLLGQFIQEELDARRWTQRDLAFILGMEETALNKIIKGKTGISLEMSRALGNAFGVDEDFFANLQKTYDLDHTPAPIRRLRDAHRCRTNKRRMMNLKTVQ